MDGIQYKADFLRNKYTYILREVNPNTQRQWGKMNFQQMVEHMADSVRIANGSDPHSLVTAADILPKMRAFLMSDKPFRENTPNSLLSDVPPTPRHSAAEESIKELEAEIRHFFVLFEGNPAKTEMNPFFGELNYDMWVQLLHKHAWHHLRQFGISEIKG